MRAREGQATVLIHPLQIENDAICCWCRVCKGVLSTQFCFYAAVFFSCTFLCFFSDCCVTDVTWYEINGFYGEMQICFIFILLGRNCCPCVFLQNYCYWRWRSFVSWIKVDCCQIFFFSLMCCPGGFNAICDYNVKGALTPPKNIFFCQVIYYGFRRLLNLYFATVSCIFLIK